MKYPIIICPAPDPLCYALKTPKETKGIKGSKGRASQIKIVN